MTHSPFKFSLREYIANSGNRCPHCGSFSIEAPDCPEVEGAAAHQRVVCNDCGKEWNDLYTLIGVDLDPSDMTSEATLPIHCNGMQERILELLSKLDRWEADPDRFRGDAADLAIKARELLHELQSDDRPTETPEGQGSSTPIAPHHALAIERMRNDGYAVVVFSAQECTRVDPRYIEEQLTQHGNDMLPQNYEEDPDEED